VDEIEASKLAKHFRLKKTLCISAFCGKYYKMERTQDKQVIILQNDEPNQLINHHPADNQRLLSVLHEVQDAHDNWLSTELMDKVAEIIQALPIECMRWYLYTMYNQNQSVSICLNFVKHHPVALNGTEDLMDYTLKTRCNWKKLQQMDF
jgi:hypothetical protein